MYVCMYVCAFKILPPDQRNYDEDLSVATELLFQGSFYHSIIDGPHIDLHFQATL